MITSNKLKGNPHKKSIINIPKNVLVTPNLINFTQTNNEFDLI